jgi:nucleoid DNA-binding protein
MPFYSITEMIRKKNLAKSERHVTGKVVTGDIIKEVCNICGTNKTATKKIIYTFLLVLASKIKGHNQISLKSLGTFYLMKLKPGIGVSKVKGEKGLYKKIYLNPRCSIRFQPNRRLIMESKWYPTEELVEKKEKLAPLVKRIKEAV